MAELKPTEVYKGVPIYLFQDTGMAPNEYGAMFEWYGRQQVAQVEDWQQPTRANILAAARQVIDILKDVEGQGLVGPDGFFKK